MTGLYPLLPNLPSFVAVLPMGGGHSMGIAEILTTVLTALIAAAVGAFATGWVTRNVTREFREQEEHDRDAAAAFAMQQKLVKIYSSLVQFRDHFVEARALRAHRKMPYLALALRPFANDSDAVQFSSDELHRMHRVGGHALLNQIADLDGRYNAIVKSNTMYRLRWLELTDDWTGVMTDGVMTTSRTEEQVLRDQPRLAMLDDIAGQTFIMIDEITNVAFQACRDLFMARGDKLGLRQRMEIKAPHGGEVTLQSMPFGEPGNLMDRLRMIVQNARFRRAKIELPGHLSERRN